MAGQETTKVYTVETVCSLFVDVHLFVHGDSFVVDSVCLCCKNSLSKSFVSVHRPTQDNMNLVARVPGQSSGDICVEGLPPAGVVSK